MKQPGLPRILLIASLSALAIYVVGYTWMYHRQTRLGPWEVTFTTLTNTPAIVINQPRLGIQGVQVAFVGASVASNVFQTLRFDRPKPWPYDVPFGRCIFMDTMILPGNVTLELFGHEVQLLPRTLTLDRREFKWTGTTNIVAGELRPAGQ